MQDGLIDNRKFGRIAKRCGLTFCNFTPIRLWHSEIEETSTGIKDSPKKLWQTIQKAYRQTPLVMPHITAVQNCTLMKESFSPHFRITIKPLNIIPIEENTTEIGALLMPASINLTKLFRI